MQTTELDQEAIRVAATAIPEDTPVLMLNLLRYNEHADYGDRTDIAPCSGRAAYYQRYVPAFNKIAPPGQVKVLLLGAVQATLVAPPGEQWDDVAIVEYASFAALRTIIESAEYKAEADPHRRAAVADWRFVALTRGDSQS